MKKILIDVNPVVPYYVSGKLSGIGRTTRELVSALDKQENLPFEIQLYSQNMKGIGGRNLQTHFKCHHLYLPNRETFNKLSAFCHCREFLAGYDLMHITHNFEYVAEPEKCIVTLHDALFMHIQEKAFGHEKMKEIVPPFIRKCRRIITCSEYSKADIMETMQVPEDKIDVIYWGINHDNFYRRDEAIVSKYLQRIGVFDKYFLSVSCNAERKRTDELVRAYLDYWYNDATNHLVLVWANPPQGLLDEIARHPAKNHIHFLSNVSDEDLAFLYSGATATFTPSSFEGFGLPLIEAMACGCPVITADNSSLSEIAADAAILLSEPVRKSMTDVMSAFENNVFALSEMRTKGMARAAFFTWEKAAKQTIETYKKSFDF